MTERRLNTTGLGGRNGVETGARLFRNATDYALGWVAAGAEQLVFAPGHRLEKYTDLLVARRDSSPTAMSRWMQRERTYPNPPTVSIAFSRALLYPHMIPRGGQDFWVPNFWRSPLPPRDRALTGLEFNRVAAGDADPADPASPSRAGLSVTAISALTRAIKTPGEAYIWRDTFTLPEATSDDVVRTQEVFSDTQGWVEGEPMSDFTDRWSDLNRVLNATARVLIQGRLTTEPPIVT